MTYCMTFLFSKKVKRIKGRWWVEDLHDSLSLFYLKSRSSLLLFNPLNDDRGQKSKNPKIQKSKNLQEMAWQRSATYLTYVSILLQPPKRCKVRKTKETP